MFFKFFNIFKWLCFLKHNQISVHYTQPRKMDAQRQQQDAPNRLLRNNGIVSDSLENEVSFVTSH